jgi:DNA polymerase
MDVFTIDFETYYSKTFSLSKMSTEAYVSDEQFQIIMVGVKKNDDPTVILSFQTNDEYKQALEAMGVHRGAVLCHNTMFDALILETVLGIIPPMLLDTLCMAQAVLKPFHRSISLAKCLEHESSPLAKGTYVGNMLGRRLESLNESEFQKYAQYCSDDCDGEWWLFNRLKERLPKDEFLVIDMTLRMYIEPQFVLDKEILVGFLHDTREKKKALLAALPDTVNQSDLSSNPKFAQVLEKLGVDVPYKISPTTLKPTYAFAKTDPEFKDLEDEYADDPIIAPILAARLGTKSTLAESRAMRFIDIADDYGKLRVPLRYYGAHTGRYGGMEKINCQNLTRIDPKNPSRNQLRYAVAAPEGYVVLASDLSQIEARLNAWLSNCIPLLQVFRTGGDPYCAFATQAFERPITKADEKERFIGKTCILGLGYGMGWKKLQSTLRKDGFKASEQDVKKWLYRYRDVYHQIPALWKFCDGLIEQMATGECMTMLGPLMATKDRLTLPNGMAVWYHNLRWVEDKKYTGWSFTHAERPKTLWGGKMVENIVQSLARITITEHMVRIRKELNLRPALQAHDELVYVVPEMYADDWMNHILRIMKTPPSFAPDLPIDAEAAWGKTYGDAK